LKRPEKVHEEGGAQSSAFFLCLDDTPERKFNPEICKKYTKIE
jgi:hypothetical protein